MVLFFIYYFKGHASGKILKLWYDICAGIDVERLVISWPIHLKN